MSSASVSILLFVCLNATQFGDSFVQGTQKNKITDSIALYVNFLPEILISVMEINYYIPTNLFFREIYIYEKNRIHSTTFQIYSRNEPYKVDIKYKYSIAYKINFFYICLSCEFGRWIKNTLFEIIKDLPIFYHIDIFHVLYGNEFEKKLKKSSETAIKLFDYVDKFIYILSTLIYVEEYTVSSNETTVLHILYEIKFKIQNKYVKNLRYSFNSNKNYDQMVVRDFLEIINKTQSYIILNCHSDELSFEPENVLKKKYLYGYSINLKTYDNDFINKLLESTKLMRMIKDSNTYCTTNQMLLKDLIHYDRTKGNESMIYLSEIIGGAEITLAEESNSMTIGEILNKTQDMSDLEFVYFYLSTIFKTMMKIMFVVTEPLVTKRSYAQYDVQFYFTDNFKKIQKIKNKIPKMFVDYFEYLVEISSSFEKSDTILDNLKLYFKNNVYDIKLCNLKLNNIGDDLSKFINDIVDVADYFECANDLYQFLRFEYDKYYVPFIVESNVRQFILPTKNRNIISKTINNMDECNYVNSIYLLCVEIIINLNNINNSKNAPSRKAHAWVANEIFSRIQKYFQATIESKLLDHNILKIAYNSFIIMANIKCITDVSYVDNCERAVYLFMTELNGYSLKYCTHQTGFLIHQNVDFSDVGKRDVLENRIIKLLNINVESLRNSIPLLDYAHFDLQSMYETFVKKSTIFTSYDHIVYYYWKGEKKKFSTFYAHLKSKITLGPHFLYAFYDFYFKFYVGVLYIEIDKIIKNLFMIDSDLRTINNDSRFILFKELVKEFSMENFPKKLWPIIIKLKQFAENMINRQTYTIEHKKFVLRQLKNEFRRMFIVFDNTSEKIPGTELIDLPNNKMKAFISKKLKSNQYKRRYILLQELPNVQRVLKKYYKLQKFNETEQPNGSM